MKGKTRIHRTSDSAWKGLGSLSSLSSFFLKSSHGEQLTEDEQELLDQLKQSKQKQKKKQMLFSNTHLEELWPANHKI